MDKINKRAVLEFSFSRPARELSAAYRRVAEKNIGLEPAIFKLPWPVDMIPEIGSRFESVHLPAPFDKGVVQDVGYIYSRQEGILVEVQIETDEERRTPLFDDECLTHLAEQGFVFESNVPITKALKDAGLPTTVAAFRRGKAK